MKRKFNCLIMAFTLLLSCSLAAFVQAPPASAAAAAPCYISSNYGEDAMTQLQVGWQNSIDEQYLEITVFADILYARATRYRAEVTSFEIEETGWNYPQRYVCRVKAEDLTPAAKYRYKVGREGAWSPDYYHTTPGGGGTFSFSVFSDPQTFTTEAYNANMGRVVTAALNENPSSSFFLINGDIAEVGGIESHYGSFFEAMTARYDMPIVTAPGNHDTVKAVSNSDGSQNYDENMGEARVYNSMFYNPDNGPDFPLPQPNNPKNSSYYFHHDGAMFIMLNTQYASAQLRLLAEWLDAVLEDNETNQRSKYIIVGMHKGPIGNYYYGSSAINTINTIFCPVFEKYKVDLVMSGHDHTYARTAPTKNNIAVSDVEGTVYSIVGSCGPKFNTAKDGASEQFEVSVDKQRAGIVTNIYVDPIGMTVEAKYLDGETVDSYFIPAKRDIREESGITANFSATQTTATLNLNLGGAKNVTKLQVEKQDETVLAELNKSQTSYTVTGLIPKSAYGFQWRVFFSDGTTAVKRLTVQTVSFLTYSASGQIITLTSIPQNATGYKVLLNNRLLDNMHITSRSYPLYNLIPGGSYLVRVEIYSDTDLLEYDYIFISP